MTILLVAVFLGGFLIFYQSRPVGQNAPATNQTGQQTNGSEKWETKTDDQANVTIVVTPLDLSPQSAEWKFGIVMDTHSVELDQDMTKIAVLVDDRGKKYTPLNWEGSTGGHHREGVLVFNSISPLPQSLELKITGIGKVDKNFTWQLK